MRHDEENPLDYLEGTSGGTDEERRLLELWERLGDLPDPQPVPDMRRRFYSMLERYGERLPIRRRIFGSRRRILQLALAVLVLGLAVSAGYLLRASESGRLENEVAGLRKLVVLSLLQQPQAAERLRGVDWSARIEQPDQEILDALIRTLHQDANLNVRLAAIDALIPAADRPAVQHAFVAALLEEEEPLVRMALIDALVAVKTREAAEALRRVSQDGAVEQDVRTYAEQQLRTLL